MNSIFRRVSVREFEDKAVEPEKVELLLRAAFASPSARNQQPWEFYVVTDKYLLSELSKASPFTGCTKKAPLAIVPCYDTNRLASPAYAHIDMSACCENILLEAVELDLGAVWLGIAPIPERMEYVGRLLHMPENLKAFAIIPVGYPAVNKSQENRYNESRVHYLDKH